jgi:hypothetical protein
MALPQAEGGAMGPKDGVGAVDRGAEARHGRPYSFLEGSDVRPVVRGRRQPPRGSEKCFWETPQTNDPTAVLGALMRS